MAHNPGVRVMRPEYNMALEVNRGPGHTCVQLAEAARRTAHLTLSGRAVIAGPRGASYLAHWPPCSPLSTRPLSLCPPRGHSVQTHVLGCWRELHCEPWKQFPRRDPLCAKWSSGRWDPESVCVGQLQGRYMDSVLVNSRLS